MNGRPSKIWIVAGESSGDLYGAQLTRDLKRLEPSLEIAGMGGAKMREAGVRLLADSTELGVVGIVEVLGILFKIIRIMLLLVREAEKERPDAVVLIVSEETGAISIAVDGMLKRHLSTETVETLLRKELMSEEATGNRKFNPLDLIRGKKNG